MTEHIQRPSLGICPHQVSNRDRNIDLANAIRTYLKEYYKSGNTQQQDVNILEAVRGWAMEIMFNCDTELEFMKKE